MNLFKKTVLAATAALVLGFGTSAHALPINGDITFGGILDPAMNLETGPTVLFGPVIFVTSVTGALDSTIDVGNLVTFNDFDLPFTGAQNPLWTAGGFTFALTSVTVSPRSALELDIRGRGILSGNGFDATPYAWSFSADRTSQNAIGFSATNAVPEPGTMMLMGSGLLGLGFWRRFKK